MSSKRNLHVPKASHRTEHNSQVIRSSSPLPASSASTSLVMQLVFCSREQDLIPLQNTIEHATSQVFNDPASLRSWGYLCYCRSLLTVDMELFHRMLKPERRGTYRTTEADCIRPNDDQALYTIDHPGWVSTPTSSTLLTVVDPIHHRQPAEATHRVLQHHWHHVV